MRITPIEIAIIVSIFQLGCGQQSKTSENFDFNMTCEAPDHAYFIKKNIKWDREYEKQHQPESLDDNLSPKKIGIDVLDTMFILTDDKLILIRGLYSYYNNDTIRMPQSGEFGVNFNVMDKGDFDIKKSREFTFKNSKYIRHDKLEYQWWCLIKDKLKVNKENSITVSGP